MLFTPPLLPPEVIHPLSYRYRAVGLPLNTVIRSCSALLPPSASRMPNAASYRRPAATCHLVAHPRAIASYTVPLLDSAALREWRSRTRASGSA